MAGTKQSHSGSISVNCNGVYKCKEQVMQVVSDETGSGW